jgi:hypothetical protein
MQEAPPPGGLGPADLRFLKRLVTALTLTMILGLLTIVTLLVIRLGPAPLALPEAITLPDGARATAFTQSGDWFAVVTEEGEILIYDRATAALRQRVRIGE